MAIMLHRAKTKLETFMRAEKRTQLDMDDSKWQGLRNVLSFDCFFSVCLCEKNA